jgi:prevent-host-death family protein
MGANDMARRIKSAVPDVNVAEGIVPLGTFKARAGRYLRELADQDEPIVITQNGKPVAVVLSPAAFEDIRARQEYLEAVARGIEDADEGDLVDHRKVGEWLSSWGKAGERPPPRR